MTANISLTGYGMAVPLAAVFLIGRCGSESTQAIIRMKYPTCLVLIAEALIEVPVGENSRISIFIT